MFAALGHISRHHEASATHNKGDWRPVDVFSSLGSHRTSLHMGLSGHCQVYGFVAIATNTALLYVVDGKLLGLFHTSVAGRELLLSSEMEVRSLIRKPLQPARPIRRCIPDNGAVFMVNLQARFSDHCRDGIKDRCNLWCSIEKLHDVLEDPVMEKSPGKPAVNNKKDRITYSRDVLMQLSNVSVSKQKPKYLPDLPITLQHPRRIALSNGSEKKTKCTDVNVECVATSKFILHVCAVAILKELCHPRHCDMPPMSEISSLHCAPDPSVSAHMRNTHPTA